MIKLVFFIIFWVNFSEQVQEGRDASEGDYPFVVSLQGAFDDHFCMGSILNNEWILTAAHCLIDKKPVHVVVKVGTMKLHGREAKTHYGKEIKLHDKYDRFSKKNDIALLRVKPSIKFNDKVTSVSLVSNTEITSGEIAVFAGWGRLKRGGTHPEILQEMDVEIKNIDERRFDGKFDVRTQICSLVDKTAICNGDSGGPLMAHKMLIGIASITRCLCQATFNVYTNVKHYLEWIKHYVTL